MSECYLIEGGDFLDLYPGFNVCQSFIVMEPHILLYVDLNLKVLPNPRLVLVTLYHADSYGHPVGSAISRSEIYWFDKKERDRVYRVRFAMTGRRLLTGGPYALVVWSLYDWQMSQVSLEYDKDDATYPRGHLSTAEHPEMIWTDYPGSDLIFGEFGTPPLPKPEPKPPIPNFAVLDLDYICTMDGVKIYLPTSVPCHLTCYWTNKTPRKHRTTRTYRGVPVQWSAYWCFVAWTAVEQDEPGDTLYHTFTLEPWPECETRWFTFKGERHMISCPSIGPIFEKHNEGPFVFIKNPSFEQWPDPLLPPTYWLWTDELTHNVTAHRDDQDKTHGKYSLRLEATGVIPWRRLYQDIDAVPLRGKWIDIRPDMKGAPIYSTGFYISIDGTPPFWKQVTPTSPDYWDWGMVTRKVPLDATKIHVECRVDFFPNQPNTCRLDNIRNIVIQP